MAKYNIVTDKLNNYFTTNKLTVAASKPTSGSWVKGDVVISSSLTDSIFGWVCKESGTPGTWMILKTSDELTGDSNVESHYHDTRYYKKAEVDTKLGTKSDNGHNHNGSYYTKTESNNLLNGKSNNGHTHDDRYYTEGEVNNLLNGKSNTNHNHDGAYYLKWEIDNKIGVQGGRKLHVQDWDPGAVGAGHVWIKTS